MDNKLIRFILLLLIIGLVFSALINFIFILIFPNTFSRSNLLLFLATLTVAPLLTFILIRKSQRGGEEKSPNGIFYLLAFLTLLMIPIQQFLIGLISPGGSAGGFGVPGCTFNETLQKIHGCTIFWTPLTSLILMLPLVLLAVRLFNIAGGVKNYKYFIAIIFNFLAGAVIIVGEIGFQLFWFFGSN